MRFPNQAFPLTESQRFIYLFNKAAVKATTLFRDKSVHQIKRKCCNVDYQRDSGKCKRKAMKTMIKLSCHISPFMSRESSERVGVPKGMKVYILRREKGEGILAKTRAKGQKQFLSNFSDTAGEWESISGHPDGRMTLPWQWPSAGRDKGARTLTRLQRPAFECCVFFFLSICLPLSISYMFFTSLLHEISVPLFSSWRPCDYVIQSNTRLLTVGHSEGWLGGTRGHVPSIYLRTLVSLSSLSLM